MMDNCTVVTNS